MEKISKNQERNYKIKISQLKAELKTDRHILACLGSVGLTFTDDLDKFKGYLERNRERDLLTIINNNRALTREELKAINLAGSNGH